MEKQRLSGELRKAFCSELSPIYDHAECREIFLQLAGHITGRSRTSLTAFPELPFSEQACAAMENARNRLLMGEPLQYITGTTEFYGLPLSVGPGVLIPRPETEELVALALQCLKTHKPEVTRIIDAGTGSGCIALALAQELPGAGIMAADCSAKALSFAARNARSLNLRIRLCQKDILNDEAFDAFRGTTLIISNPPYIPRSEEKDMHINVKNFEPQQALFVPDEDPLLFYRALAGHAQKILAPGGILLCETHHLTSEALHTLAPKGFESERFSDLSGKYRYWMLRKSNA